MASYPEGAKVQVFGSKMHKNIFEVKENEERGTLGHYIPRNFVAYSSYLAC
jgi:hypothetical protein